METVKPKRTLVEETYDILVDAICSGELSPGTRLNQDKIAAQLKVSRQPVNSAISLLKANALVEDTGKRGVIVTSFDHELFRSIYEYRLVIEPFAVRLAGQTFSKAERQLAAKVLRIGDKALKSGKLSDLLQADMMFHEMIYGWSRNHVIVKSMSTNWHHIRRSMAEVLRNPSTVIPIWEEHSEIAENLLAGCTEDAAEIMERHIN
ncbi:unnamed protein product, partial [Ectocarpus sp. 12 AP-2014]